MVTNPRVAFIVILMPALPALNTTRPPAATVGVTVPVMVCWTLAPATRLTCCWGAVPVTVEGVAPLALTAKLA